MTECDAVVSAFLRDLQGEFHIRRESDAVCSITAPFESWDGDAIHIYVERLGARYVLSDEGETLAKLLAFNVRRESLDEHISGIARAHGVHQEGQALVRISQETHLREAFLDFIAAVQKISALEIRRRAERAQHFDVKVRNALTLRRVPYDANWWPESGGYTLPVDFASRNHHALFLALGTVQVGQAQLAYLRQKLFTYADLQAKGLADSYERVVVMDEGTRWEPQALELAGEYADHQLEWPQQSESVEAILLENNGGLRI